MDSSASNNKKKDNVVFSGNPAPASLVTLNLLFISYKITASMN